MKKILRSFILLFLFIPAILSQAQLQVTTFAGSGIGQYANGNGADASFYYPTSITIDNAGNLYVSDNNNNVIRKITPLGDVSTWAGFGGVGTANGPGASASFAYPNGVAADAFGNVYVTDGLNNLIRKINSSGVVSTLAGSTTAGHVDGTGTAARFDSPYGIAVDALGNVYVADNSSIRKITSAGVVTTLAGSGTLGNADGAGSAASFKYPYGLVVDALGNVYVADTYNHLIRKVTQAGVVTTFAGSSTYGNTNGTGTAAMFNTPKGIQIDADGNLYIADSGNNVIRKITSAGVVTTYAGSGTAGKINGLATDARFSNPSGMAIDANGNMYVSDEYNNQIRKISPATTTAIRPLELSVDMMLYPVPASDRLTLSLTLQQEAEVRLELINSSGTKVASVDANFSSGNIEMNLSVESMPTGMYVANIYCGGQVTSQKVIIAR